MIAAHRTGPAARALIGVVAALSLWLAAAAPAQGAEAINHAYKKVILGGYVKGSEPPVASLEDPCGVALGSVGESYIADYYRNSLTVPAEGPVQAEGPCALAIDAEGDLFVNTWHGGVAKYTPNIYPPPGPGEPPLLYSTEAIDSGPATGIAVDPATGDLLVDHRDRIDVYGAPVQQEEAPFETIGLGSLGDAYGVAISSFSETQGQVYVADAADETIKVFDPAVSLTTPVRTIDGASTPQKRFVSLFDATLATDQFTGELFVADDLQPGFEHPQAAVYEFNYEGLYRGQLEHVLVDPEPMGIAVNETLGASRGELYVTSGNGSSQAAPTEGGPPLSETGSVYAFGPPGAGHRLSAAVSGAGEGSVTSSPAGIDCPGACAAEFNSGKTVSMTATPAPGSAFAGWSGACTGSGACQVTLSSDASVGAEFEEAPSFNAVLHEAPRASSSAESSSTRSGTLRLGRPRALGGGAATLRTTVSGPGALVATGPGLRRARLSVSRSGAFRLRLRLDRSGVRALRRSRRGRVSLRVSVAFRPSSGAAAINSSKIVDFTK